MQADDYCSEGGSAASLRPCRCGVLSEAMSADMLTIEDRGGGGGCRRRIGAAEDWGQGSLVRESEQADMVDGA